MGLPSRAAGPSHAVSVQGEAEHSPGRECRVQTASVSAAADRLERELLRASGSRLRRAGAAAPLPPINTEETAENRELKW